VVFQAGSHCCGVPQPSACSAPHGSRLVIAGWVQLFSLMEGEGLPDLHAPPRAAR
jgi:hypothetical protein